MLDITVRHLLVPDRNHTVRVEAADVAAGDTRKHRVDLAARHQLGLLDRPLYGLDRRLDVDDHAFLQPARGLRADAQHLDRAVQTDLAHQRHDFRSADVEPDYEISFGALKHPGHRLL